MERIAELNMNRSFLVALASMGVALALASAACTSAGADKAGGSKSKVMVLTLADTESDPSNVQPFADAVKALSGGTMQIQIQVNWRAGDPQYEGHLITDVEQGKADLGVAGVRAFDTVGVDSFQATQAPFLIDTYALEKEVLASDIPAKMLEGVTPLGLVGLGVLPGPLRKPLGLTRSLVSASDYRGARIGIRPGKVADATMRALGATPVAYLPGDASSLDGMEMQLDTIEANNYDQGATELTGNVDFWPRDEAVFSNARVFGALSAQQRDWLRKAGARSLSSALSNLPQGNAAMSDILCNRGLTLVSATTAEVAQLRQRVRPVYGELERNPQTRAFIAEITKVRREIGGFPDAVSPCADSSAPIKTTTVTPLDGTWEVSYTRKVFEAVNTDPSQDIPENWGHFTLTFHRGDVEATGSNPGGSWSGIYLVRGKTLTLHWSEYDGTMTWSIYRGMLTFTGDIPTGFLVKPWRRVGP
jgi:TRAP-type C4-dicarboxylate transport system substrate-binding protein